MKNHNKKYLKHIIVSLIISCLALAASNVNAEGSDKKVWRTGFENGFAIAELPVPGGVAMVDIGPEILPTPNVTWNGQRIFVQKNKGRWVAAIGIPLDTKPGSYVLDIFSTVARQSPFRVNPKTYPVQRLSITNTRKVDPNAADKARIANETPRMKRAKNTHSNRFTAAGFQSPVNGPQTSAFGLRRIYNGKPRNPHAGQDIGAPEGTPILAVASGTVIETGHFFFNGKSVFLDHGQGLITLFSHMSQIDVQTGEEVLAGDVIGLVGKTGRVTGAHLHWSVGLNGTWIDPKLLFNP